MKLKNILSTLLLILFAAVSFSQGTIQGNVKDALTNEPVFGVMIRVDGAGKVKTDFEGQFSINLNSGKYLLTFSNDIEGYTDQTIEIEVKNEAVEVIEVFLSKDAVIQQIEGITVVGTKISGGTTIAATDQKRMEENSSTDGLPKELITNTGVPSAAEAVQMIPAASVQDGKNVYIRGLGDRYSKTILNGMDIPGLDPDRNSVQLDIFPAVLIDNITVYKTFTPNLVADFTGGLVDITTKDFPSRKTIYAKVTAGYNTVSSLNKNFLTYNGGKFDIVGFDDGTRKLPVNPNISVPHPANNTDLTTQMTSAFSDIMAVKSATSFLNQSYSFALGNQFMNDKKNPLTYGYNFAVNYSSNNVFYSDAEYSEYRKSNTRSEDELYVDRKSTGQVAQNDIMWTVLLGQSIKYKNSKIALNLFHTQNGISSAANLTQVNSESNPATIVKQSLTYNQRSITNANLSGVHFIDEKRKWKFSWKLSPTYSKISDPDMRTTALEKVTAADGTVSYELNQSVGAEIRRTFRELKEYNVSGRGDFTYSFKQWNALPSELSFGVYDTYKHRSFNVDDYTFNVKGPADETGNPDWYFQSQNIWKKETNQGVYASGQKEMANIYEATQNIAAAYIMNELPIAKNFNATYGVRVEKNMNFYTGQSNNADTDPNAPRYNNQLVLDILNLLPSVNLVYKIRNQKDSLQGFDRNTNIRAAYTQTVARPSFREISISQIYDPIQGRRYLGNIDLKQTLVHNADLRYEYFYGRTELISASMFYKKFINPIEVVANVAAPSELKPVNAGQADLYGAEIELRKAIGFKDNDKINLTFGFNFTYNVSRIDMRKVETQIGGQTFTEKEVREANAREGETIGNYRAMYGQSPYVINSYLNFQHTPSHITANISYNVQGKRLSVIGIGSLPDVYEQPFHSLNVKISKKFGKTKAELNETEPRWMASLQGQNLLNNKKRMFYESYQAEKQTYQYLNPGVTISMSIAYSIN